MTMNYRQLLANKKYQVLITGLTGGSVTALHQTDLAITGGNDYSTASEVLRDVPIAGQVLDLKDKAGGLIKLTGRSVMSQFETRLAWSNSLKPNFAVDMTFYSDDSDANDTVLKQYLRIKSGVLPTAQGAFFRAPLGYKIGTVKGQSLAPTGTLSFEIGEWFRGTNMIMVSENFTFSKEVNSKGHPILCTGSVVFEPFKAITYDEFKDYFRTTTV